MIYLFQQAVTLKHATSLSTKIVQPVFFDVELPITKAVAIKISALVSKIIHVSLLVWLLLIIATWLRVVQKSTRDQLAALGRQGYDPLPSPTSRTPSFFLLRDAPKYWPRKG